MKPELNNMQTRTLLFKVQKGILKLALTLVVVLATTVFTGFTPIPAPQEMVLPSVQGTVTIDFPSQLPEGAYAVVSPVQAWQTYHPGCSVSADIRSNNLEMDVMVSGQGDCISTSYEEIAVVSVRAKDGLQLHSYLIYTEAGGTTILFIDLE
jgi:hypothetical protein